MDQQTSALSTSWDKGVHYPSQGREVKKDQLKIEMQNKQDAIGRTAEDASCGENESSQEEIGSI